MEILLAKPRGFCAGVNYAIGIVEEALKSLDRSVFILKEIVHNKGIVEDLSRKGASPVKNIDDVPSGSIIIFSAHGVPPEFYVRARARGLLVLDATCPLVRKVHLEAIRFAKEGFHILYIGHQGHDEAIGVLAETPGSITLINDIVEAEAVIPPQTERLVYLTQTTLSVEETDAIVACLRKRFPGLQAPPKEDICYATTNRQLAARELAKRCDLVIVIGSQNSSNSQRLRECVESEGSRGVLIDDISELPPEVLKGVACIGITAGASAPESLVQLTIDELIKRFPGTTVNELETVSENMYFPVPNISKQVSEQLESVI